MLRERISEHEDTTISRFLNGIYLNIRDKVELLLYKDLMTHNKST